jgi:hypothetical protein
MKFAVLLCLLASFQSFSAFVLAPTTAIKHSVAVKAAPATAAAEVVQADAVDTGLQAPGSTTLGTVCSR